MCFSVRVCVCGRVRVLGCVFCCTLLCARTCSMHLANKGPLVVTRSLMRSTHPDSCLTPLEEEPCFIRSPLQHGFPWGLQHVAYPAESTSTMATSAGSSCTPISTSPHQGGRCDAWSISLDYCVCNGWTSLALVFQPAVCFF